MEHAAGKFGGSFKKFSVSASADKAYDLVYSRTLKLVDQQKIATDVTLTMVGPFAFQRMIKPFGSERFFVGDEQQHSFFEALHVVTPGMGEPYPIFGKFFGVVRCSW